MDKVELRGPFKELFDAVTTRETGLLAEIASLKRERDAFRQVAIHEAANADRNKSWNVDVEAKRIAEGKT